MGFGSHIAHLGSPEREEAILLCLPALRLLSRACCPHLRIREILTVHNYILVFLGPKPISI